MHLDRLLRLQRLSWLQLLLLLLRLPMHLRLSPAHSPTAAQQYAACSNASERLREERSCRSGA